MEKQNKDNKQGIKRKLENPQENGNVKTELESVSGSSKENSVKMDNVSDYSKRCRLDFNFWEDLTNPSNNTEEKVVEIKDLKIGQWYKNIIKLKLLCLHLVIASVNA